MFYFVFLMAVISCVYVQKKQEEKNLPLLLAILQRFQIQVVFFLNIYIYNSFHTSIISSVLGFSLGTVMFV